jgi:hypothetical protein
MFRVILGKYFFLFFHKKKLNLGRFVENGLLACVVLKLLWASARCENSIPAEEDVWICYICVC